MNKNLLHVFWRKVYPEDNFDNVPERSGVYLIASVLRSTREECVVYSGQSIDLHRRLKEHWSDSESNDRLREAIDKGYVLTVYYATVDVRYLDGVERFLCDSYRPQLQEKAPDVNPQPVNLPYHVCECLVDLR